MNQITCDYCGNIHTFAELNQLPEICPDCNSSLDDLEIVSSDANSPNEREAEDETTETVTPNGLTLTYRTTGQEIDIPHADPIVLGRTNAGGELLATIPHISRAHCRIEFDGGRYLISDTGSTNGTYLGPSKIDCAANPGQVLEDSAILYLGREEFLVKLKYEDVAEPTPEKAEDEAEMYRCSQCGVEFEIRDDICGSCGSYDSMERV